MATETGEPSVCGGGGGGVSILEDVNRTSFGYHKERESRTKRGKSNFVFIDRKVSYTRI